ncbi:hypothetical protein Tco_0074707, partial [Tanacetum coccineum]
VYRGNGEVGMGRVELEWYLGGGMARKTMGEGSMRLGGKVVRVRLWLQVLKRRLGKRQE